VSIQSSGSIEIIGMVGTKEVSESSGALDGAAIDADYLTRFARAHEAAGFDRVLIGYGATHADGFAVAAHVLYATSTLKVLIAHRPGFVAPTLVARKLATLDQLTGGGRVAIHHITGGDELDQKRDGDFADHDKRYARTAEFMTLLRRELTAAEPFDYEGEFYRVQGAVSSVRPAPGTIPLYFGGASAPAIATGAAHADVYMLWGEPLAQIAERIATVRGRGGGRPPYGRFGFRMSSSVGSERLQQQGRDGDVHDERLWYGITKLTGPGGNSTALVGTPRQVAEALEAYRRAGIDTVLIRGFDPLDDVIDWGRELVPAIRELAAGTPVGTPQPVPA
jgi:alkanesulfonate monooxygenase